MKNSVIAFLIVVAATMANDSFAQNTDNSIPVYSVIHHYSSEVKKENNKDTTYFNLRLRVNESDSREIKDIFSSKFKEVANALKEINQTTTVKKEGMIVIDEYGRKIYIAVIALENDHLLLEGGEFKNGIFFPNIIGLNGMSYREDENKPGWMIAVPMVIYFKTNP